MAFIKINNININKNKYLITWESSPSKYLTTKDIQIAYDFDLPDNYDIPVNIVISATLPIMAIDHDDIEIQSPFDISEATLNYWQDYLKLIFPLRTINIHVNNIAPNIISKDDIFTSENNTGTGLLFGGGVESTFALSKFYYRNPVLISIIGEKWMNNDTKSAQIKFDLEKQLCSDFNLNMQRVNTNLRTIFPGKDSFVNKYSSGPQFYFLSLPIANQFSLHTIYRAGEIEVALNFTDYDKSINLRTTIDISFKKHQYPLLLPVFTAFSKIQMLDELNKSDFLKYIYSCSNNTGNRWCGTCGKCYRISRFMETLNIDKSIIDMPEGIVGRRSKTSICKHYWANMDILYGRNRSKDIKYH